MVPWVYKDKQILSHDDLHEDCTDIVYYIEFESGQRYIGKKTVRSIRRLKPTKAQLAIRKNYVRKELKNHNFMDYKGSSTYNIKETPIKREILYQCKDKRSATYLETKLLFCKDVLFDVSYNNANIQGKFYSSVLDNVINS